MSSDEPTFSCDEPWTGRLSIHVDGDVEFCGCYLKQRIGNLAEQDMHEIWNSDLLVELRSEFAAGRLPAACQGQLCPTALGER